MHEVALAQRTLQIALDTARQNGGGRITRARMLLGALSCAEPETLRFAFGVAAKGTAADQCQLEIVHVPAYLKCRQCGKEHEGELLEPCPDCGAVGFEVLKGREMRLESIDVDQNEA